MLTRLPSKCKKHFDVIRFLPAREIRCRWNRYFKSYKVFDFRRISFLRQTVLNIRAVLLRNLRPRHFRPVPRYRFLQQNFRVFDIPTISDFVGSKMTRRDVHDRSHTIVSCILLTTSYSTTMIIITCYVQDDTLTLLFYLQRRVLVEGGLAVW